MQYTYTLSARRVYGRERVLIPTRRASEGIGGEFLAVRD